MPTYDYECPYHGVFEMEQRITENALETCPKPTARMTRDICGAPIKRLISLVAVKVVGGTPKFHG